MQLTGSIRKHIAIPSTVAKCQFLTEILINNAYIDYFELYFSEIIQFKVEKRIYFELIPTSMSRDEIGKLSGQCGQGRAKSTGKTDLGLLEIKLQLLTPTRNLTSSELYSQQPILLVL